MITLTGTGVPPVPTVSVTLGATTLPNVAEICAVPLATPVATPVVATIVADEVGDELQVTEVVMFEVLASLKVPVAVNEIVLATATEAGFGVIAIEVSEITVSVTAGVDVTPPCDAVICVVPAATPVARPVAEIVAVAGVPEFQVTVADMSDEVPSLNVPVAVNCCVAPTFKCAGVAGVTAIEVREKTVSVTAGVDVTPACDAVICVVPAATPVARPVAEIVAVAVVPEFQVTVADMSDEVPSLNVPVAVNCCVAPTFKCAGVAGVTAIEVREKTVSVTAGVDVTPACDAVICVVPAATPVARPVAEIVAVAVVPEFQVTVADMSDEVPSLNVPVAVNCCVAPTFKCAGVAGVTAIEVREKTVSVTAGVDVTPACDAVICVVPAATPVARPVAEIVAVAVVPEFQVTVADMSDEVPSLNVPVAVNCCVAPTFKCAGVAGVTAIEVSVFAGGCLIPLQPAVSKAIKNGTATAMKRRRRDFIFPPRTVNPIFLGGTPTCGRRNVQHAALQGAGQSPQTPTSQGSEP